MWRMSLHRIYVCFFSNGTFKIGVTKNPIGRLAAYVREATRFDRHVTGFWTSPLREKGSAYALETAAKRAYTDCAIPRHRETFDGSKVRGDLIAREFGPSPAEKLTQDRSEEHTSELQSLMRISYAVFCLKNK